MSALPIAIRPYDPGTDKKFVTSSWVGSWHGSKWAGVMPNDLTYKIHFVVIDRLLANGMKILMAVNPDNRDQILGFLAYEPDVVHYCFVKSLFRHQGVASFLLASANFDRSGPLLASFKTTDSKWLSATRRISHKPQLVRKRASVL
jgi:hypothetical protein